MTNPYAQGARPPNQQPDRVRGWAVAVGVVLGLFATVFWMAVVFFVAYAFTSDNAGSSAVTDGLIFGFFILPLPVAVVLLCFRRTRQAAAGFVMGLAIGTLLVAGVCSSFIVPGLVA